MRSRLDTSRQDILVVFFMITGTICDVTAGFPLVRGLGQLRSRCRGDPERLLHPAQLFRGGRWKKHGKKQGLDFHRNTRIWGSLSHRQCQSTILASTGLPKIHSHHLYIHYSPYTMNSRSSIKIGGIPLLRCHGVMLRA